MSLVNRITVCLVLLVSLGAAAASPRLQQRITEDDPRWDCRTMGNKICGPGERGRRSIAARPRRRERLAVSRNCLVMDSNSSGYRQS